MEPGDFDFIVGTIVFALIAIFLYASGVRKTALLMFCIMCYGNYGFLSLVPLKYLGLYGSDGAFLFMLFATILHYAERISKPKTDTILTREIIVFAAFLMCSIAYSLWEHRLSTAQVIAGCRPHLLFLSYFFLSSVPAKNILWVLQALFYITFVHAVVYVIQFIINTPILGVEALQDNITGKYRFMNFPVFSIFYMLMAVFRPNALGIKVPRWSAAVFLAAQICTLGRTMILGTGLVFVVGLLDFKGVSSQMNRKTVITIVVMILAITPFLDFVTSRLDNRGETQAEFSSVLSGGAQSMALSGDYHDAGTFTYRTAWFLERANHMMDGDALEKVFGLGFYAPKDNSLAFAKYHFKLGITSDDGNPNQLSTPDFSYGNMISWFGFVGSILFLLIWFRLLAINFKMRRENPLSAIVFLLIIYWIIDGFGGTRLSSASNMVVPFMITAMALNTIKEDKYPRLTKYV